MLSKPEVNVSGADIHHLSCALIDFSLLDNEQTLMAKGKTQFTKRKFCKKKATTNKYTFFNNFFPKLLSLRFVFPLLSLSRSKSLFFL